MRWNPILSVNDWPTEDGKYLFSYRSCYADGRSYDSVSEYEMYEGRFGYEGEDEEFEDSIKLVFATNRHEAARLNGVVQNGYTAWMPYPPAYDWAREQEDLPI